MSHRRSWLATFLFLTAIGTVVLAVRVLAQPQRVLMDGIAIEGSPHFVQRTRDALKLIKDNYYDGYSQLTRQVLEIEEHEKSGADVWTRCIQVGKRTSGYSLTWYASTLIHDARHISQYNDYLVAYPGKVVPPEVYSSADAELACMRGQIESLVRMNAPQKELDWARQQDGTFSDTNKDGQYDEKDYKKRDW